MNDFIFGIWAHSDINDKEDLAEIAEECVERESF